LFILRTLALQNKKPDFCDLYGDGDVPAGLVGNLRHNGQRRDKEKCRYATGNKAATGASKHTAIIPPSMFPVPDVSIPLEFNSSKMPLKGCSTEGKSNNASMNKQNPHSTANLFVLAVL
jgi:hypothetical protein